MAMQRRLSFRDGVGATIVAAALAAFPVASYGAQDTAQPSPHKIIAQLADRIYTISEVSADQDRYQDAVNKATSAIRTYLEDGGVQADLTTANKNGMTPLAMASFLGYTPVVEALLEYPTVIEAIDTPDKHGITPWMYATLAWRQSVFACNPKIVSSPFAFVPKYVTLAYYTPRNPYPAMRDALQAAGATRDMDGAKDKWKTLCVNQSEQTRARVEQSDDIQPTLIEAGAREIRAINDRARAKKPK